jgi:hypothetical protein
MVEQIPPHKAQPGAVEYEEEEENHSAKLDKSATS